MAKSDLFEMIYTLAERGFNKSLAGEGSQESRAVALILSAVDQLATAATMDETMSPSIQHAIDVLRQQIEGNSSKRPKKPPSQNIEEGDEVEDAKEEMAEEETPDSKPKEEKVKADGR